MITTLRARITPTLRTRIKPTLREVAILKGTNKRSGAS
jgi:hypothetical protein